MKLRHGLVAFLAVFACAGPAAAGVYADTLGKCLVSSSSDDDKIALARWIFSAMSANPKLSDMVSISASQRDALDHQFAQISQRLLLKDCRKETVDALKFEGDSIFEKSFAVLGEAATQEVMNNPDTQAAVAKFANYFDKQALLDLEKEAGVPVDAGAK